LHGRIGHKITDHIGGSSRACQSRSAIGSGEAQTHQTAAGGPQGRLPGLPLDAPERQGAMDLNAACARLQEFLLMAWRDRQPELAALRVMSVSGLA
jgi:hypothetical protein